MSTRLRRHECHVAGFALMFLGLSASVTPAATQSMPSQIFVRYDASLSDSVLAALSTTIAAEVDPMDWPVVTVRDGDGIETIVDRYYDLYAVANSSSVFSRPRPIATATVKELITDTNDNIRDGLVVGDRIRIPPLPAALEGGDLKGSFRVFDPVNRAYSLVDSRGDLWMAEGVVEEASGSQWRAAERSLVALSAASADALPKDAQDLEYLRPDLVNVELLQVPRCDGANGVFERSPYTSAARARVAAELDDLRNGAVAGPTLYLLDFDFTDGHGRNVRKTVMWVLRAFGVPEELNEKVKSVELNPAALGGVSERSQMSQVLLDYFNAGDRLGVLRTDFDSAAGWVLSANGSANHAIRQLHPFVIQAQLWDILRQGNWLNASWRIQSSTAIRPIRFDELIDKGSFATVAAGNDINKPIRASLEPQATAFLHQQFVNVTYGTPGGIVHGSMTRPNGLGGVDLNAVGCGFYFTDSQGSSLASALVSASAWVKRLLDGTTSSDMRAELIRSSLLTASQTAVESGGFFDPARLIVPWQAHYLDPERTTVTPLIEAELATNCQTFSGRRDVVVYEEGNRYYMVVRHDDPQRAPFVRVEPPCELSSLRFDYRTNQGRFNIDSPKAFVAVVGHLTF